MATRMQQRRGTAAQWISTNSGNGPILNAGEIGYETDTNKFKIGDGTNHWINLDYFIDANSTVNPAFGSSIVFEGSTANDFETTVQVTDPTADRTITIPNATGTVVLADGSGNVTVSGDLTVSGTTTTINSTTINATTGIVFEGATANAFETTLTVVDPTADRVITFPDATGTVALIETVNTSLGGYIETSDIGGVSGVAGLDSSLNLIVPGSSIIIEGATDNTFETTLTVTDPTADRTLTLPDANGTLTTKDYVDNLVSNHASPTTNIHGIIDTALLVTTTGTQTITNKTLADPTITIASKTISATEIGYLDGVTSDIQTQITAGVTALSNHEADTTGVHGIADFAVLATTTNVSTAQTAAQTFATGAVTAHDSDTTNIHGIADTTLLVTTTGTQTLTNKTITTPAGLVKADVGLGSVDNTADASKPVSTAQASAISTAKAEAIADATSQVSALLTGAPAALNTLDELAAALGDDENFAASVTASLGLKVDSVTPISQKTDSYTLSLLSERDDLIEMSKATAMTLTIPTNATVAWPVGTSIDILQTGVGQVTIAGAGEVTVNATPGLKLRTQYSSATLFKRAENTWVVFGDLTA